MFNFAQKSLMMHPAPNRALCLALVNTISLVWSGTNLVTTQNQNFNSTKIGKLKC